MREIPTINAIINLINHTQGATVQDWKIFNGKSGYVVGCGNIETVTIKNKTHLRRVVSRNYAKNVGFWLNEGDLYIDKIRIVHDVKRAITLAHENNELAIWDIAGKSEINTIIK